MHRSKSVPVHVDVSVITEWFLTEETRIQEMRLSIIESEIMESSRNCGSRRGNRVLMVIIAWMVVVVVIGVSVFAETVHSDVRERTWNDAVL